MRLLADTHVVLWYASRSPHLRSEVLELLLMESSEVFFSLESLREIAIKASLGRPEFQYEARTVYSGLVASNWKELRVTPEHIFELSQLPLIHRDPFDRMLVAQSRVEGLTLVTADKLLLAQYHVAVLSAK